ncbi:MAG: hypothetical protein JSR60_20715 [Proteobacteria bacterium]|nr:hypothetical protein [Pseudomonadota bacterium]
MTEDAQARGVDWWADKIRADDGKISPPIIAAMSDLPRFSEAARMHLRGTLAMQASNPMVLRLANDGVRLMLAYIALYMDARGGLTRQAVRELFASLGLSSPGRAAALLMQLRLIKFIEVSPEQPDRRSKLYIPTAAMKSAFIDLMEMGLEATALLVPDASSFIPHFQEPVFFRGFVLSMGEGLVRMVQLQEGQPRNMFVDATAGHLMLYRLIMGSDETVYPPYGALPFVATALAKEFRVARSHVRRTFDRAAEREHIYFGPDHKTITLTEPFREHLAEIHAAMFLNNLRCISAAREYARSRNTAGA